MSDEETFARLLFYGVTLLGRLEREVWLMPLGALLDQWEIYKQFHGIVQPAMERYIDDIMFGGI